MPPWELRIQEQNRQRRYSRYEEVRRMMQTGASKAAIARETGLDHRTVGKFMQEVFPEAAPRRRGGIVDPYADYLDRRLQEGCDNITQLWRELREQGFGGQLNIVRRWLRCNRGHRPQGPSYVRRKAIPRVSSRQTVWHILKPTPAAQPYLDELYRASPEIAAMAQLAKDFFRIVREKDRTALDPWLLSAKKTALVRFVNGVERDRKAVKATLTLPWSQGQVHRLKLIKRQMYGRASFDLLRLRVLQNA